MILKYRFSNLIICSRYFLFTFVFEVILMAYFYFNPYEFFFEGTIIVTILSIFWFLAFTINYLYKSQNPVAINLKTRTILISGKEIKFDKLTRIEKIQSYKTSDSDIPYMPWFAGIYYFYRINYNGNYYLITSFMLNRKETKELDFVLMGKYRIRNRFFPFIF